MTLSKLHDKNLDESDLLTVSLISPTQSFYPSSLQILFSVRHRGLGRNHTQRSYKTSVLALLGVRCFFASSYNRVIHLLMKGLVTMMWDFVLSVAGWIFAGLVFLSILWAGFVLYRRSVKSWFFCSLSWTLSSQNCSEKRKREKGSFRAGWAGHRHFVQVNVCARAVESVLELHLVLQATSNGREGG